MSKKMLKLKISHDKVLDCLIDPDRIEMIRVQSKNSCALYLRSGKVYGCLHTAEAISRAAGYDIVTVDDDLDSELSAIEEPQGAVVAKQPAAVYSERGATEAPVGRPRKVIDSVAPAAVIVEERKKSMFPGIKKRPRGMGPSAAPANSVTAVVSAETTS